MSDQGDQRDHVEEMAAHKRERTQQLEESLREELGAMSYPVETSDVQAAYADGRIDVPNETEALSVAFDRLTDDETYETEQEVREELLGEITGEAGRERDDLDEYNPERDLEEIDEQERAGVGGETSDAGSDEVVDREAGKRVSAEREEREEDEWIEGREDDLVEEGASNHVEEGESSRAADDRQMESDERVERDDLDRMERDEPE